MHKLVNFYKGYHFVKYYTNTKCIQFVNLTFRFCDLLFRLVVFCVYFVTNDIYKRECLFTGIYSV